MFWQLVIKTADSFNSIGIILMAKISSKKVCEKVENSPKLKKVLLVCNRNADLLRLVGATFDSKVATLRTIKKKNLLILNKKQKVHHNLFYFFVVVDIWVVKYQLKVFGKFERTYNNAVFKILLNIITICIFIEHYY